MIIFYYKIYILNLLKLCLVIKIIYQNIIINIIL